MRLPKTVSPFVAMALIASGGYSEITGASGTIATARAAVSSTSRNSTSPPKAWFGSAPTITVKGSSAVVKTTLRRKAGRRRSLRYVVAVAPVSRHPRWQHRAAYRSGRELRAVLYHLSLSLSYEVRFGVEARPRPTWVWGPITRFSLATPKGTSRYDGIVLADGPVAFWDIADGGSREVDLSGWGNTATYKGGQPSLVTMPNGDPAADFNPNGGSGEYLTVPSRPAFSISTTGALTWEAWIRPDVLQFPHLDSTNEYVDFVGKCQSYSPTCEWEGRMYATVTSENRANRISAYAFNPNAGLGSASDWQPSSNLLQAGQWLYVVGEYTTLTSPADCGADDITHYPGALNIWVNGVEWNQPDHADTGCMAQHDVIPTHGDSPLDIGTMALDTWFNGGIGKVAVYDRLLTQAQINAHYAAMTAGAQPSGSCGDTCTVPVPTP
jgi:Concanavalin A-like lectin/glucanases superfamily